MSKTWTPRQQFLPSGGQYPGLLSAGLPPQTYVGAKRGKDADGRRRGGGRAGAGWEQRAAHEYGEDVPSSCRPPRPLPPLRHLVRVMDGFFMH